MSDVGLDAQTRVNIVESRANNSETMVRYDHRVWSSGSESPSIFGGAAFKIGVTRWSSDVKGAPLEIVSNCALPEHVITVPLKPARIFHEIGGKSVHNGPAVPGGLFMLGPHGQNSRTIYHDAFDNFRFHPSNGLIAETYEGTIGRPAPSGLQLFDYHFAEDRTLRHLVMAAFAMSKYEDHALIGLESLGMALAAHLVGTYCKKASRSSRKPSTPLAAWRLKRVTEYIEARLAHDISLAELSVVAGLSRMHFAAQFRAATGISPHSYVMRQKICAAQTLLSNQFMAIHDIAISVGFKSNAHFARVFQRILGISPIRWRRAINSS